jgi:hypothetical protein
MDILLFCCVSNLQVTRILGLDAREVQRLTQKLLEGLRDGRLNSAIFYASDGTWPVPVTTGLCSCRFVHVLAGPPVSIF